MIKKFPELHNFNDMYTPPEAINSIEKIFTKKQNILGGLLWVRTHGR